MKFGYFLTFVYVSILKVAMTLWLCCMILSRWSNRSAAFDHCVLGLDDT